MGSECTDAQSGGAAVVLEGIAAALELVGEDPTREGLVDTPSRWLKAFREMTSGSAITAEQALATAFDAEGYDEIIAVVGVPFVSLCEHHLLSFSGEVDVAYVPSGRIVGLSKIPRWVEAVSRRLQVQERMTVMIADGIEQVLKPQGVAVLVRGSHSCMRCRGVRSPGEMVTSKVGGVFMDVPEARAEVLALFDARSRHG